MLHCAPDATLLYWGEKRDYKSIFLDQVESIRLGLDVDPATPPHLVPPATNGVKPSSSTAKQAAKAGVLYGTETLRRNCKHDDLALCFSLILPSRYGLVASQVLRLFSASTFIALFFV